MALWFRLVPFGGMAGRAQHEPIHHHHNASWLHFLQVTTMTFVGWGKREGKGKERCANV